MNDQPRALGWRSIQPHKGYYRRSKSTCQHMAKAADQVPSTVWFAGVYPISDQYLSRFCCRGRVRRITNSCHRHCVSPRRQSRCDPSLGEREIFTQTSKTMAQGACKYFARTSRSGSGVLLLWLTRLRFPTCRCVRSTDAGRRTAKHSEGSDLQ